jgi:hypothetical protein
MRIEVLVGMIASGKGLYARRRADEGALVVCHDDLTQMLHGGAYRYEEGLRKYYRRMEQAIVAEAIWVRRDAVIDRTHLTAESRRRWIDFAHRLRNEALIEGDREIYRGLPVVAVAFPIEAPGIHARRRFESDPRGRTFEEWLFVAEHHWTQAQEEPLSEDEGFAEIIRPEVNL